MLRRSLYIKPMITSDSRVLAGFSRVVCFALELKCGLRRILERAHLSETLGFGKLFGSRGKCGFERKVGFGELLGR